MPTILVLGAGQVGTFAARAMEEQDASVIAADVRPAPGFFARFGPRGEVALVTADILDPSTISGLTEIDAVDAIVLCAGLVGQACSENPRKAWEINVLGARRVAEAAIKAGVRRLVFVSTFAVYGNPSIEQISETTPVSPRSEYGRTKAAAEEALIAFRNDDFEVRILRPCGTYGPLRLGRGSHSARFIEALLMRALRAKEVTLHSAPHGADEYIYVKDLGQAIALAALEDAFASEIVFNVGPGHKTSAWDLASVVQTVVPGSTISVEYTAPADPSPMPPLDVSRIRNSFGFEPRFNLANGFADYLSELGLER